MSPALAGKVGYDRPLGPRAVPKGLPASASIEVISTLRQLAPRFLENLGHPELLEILRAATLRRFPVNSTIIHQGNSADHAFLLIKGRARYFFLTQDGQKKLLHWLTPGEMFGGATLMSKRSHYLVSTEAIRHSSVLVWERDIIRELARRYPVLLENTLAIAWDYLNASLAIHLSLTCHTARQRLAQVLANLASGIGHKLPQGVEILVSNEELANAANVTPFTASRLLSDWQRKGLLTKRRGRILLHKPEHLLLHEL